MSDLVQVDRRGNGVWVLTLNDPDRRNAIGPAMHAALIERVDEAVSDPATRALVITGAGSAFCAGADLPAVFGTPGRGVDEIRRSLQEYYRCFLRVRDVPFPAIAAVNGAAVGAGLNLALCCDIRFAGPRAKFGATFAGIGLNPGGGCSYFLVQAMGAQRAMRVLLQGATLDAEAAVTNQLADELTEDPLAASLALADQIAALPAELARDIKQSVQIAAAQGFEATLQFEAWAQASSGTRPQIYQTVERFRARSQRT